jgi:predicted TIM-barrel fold metal-dependent hydrolase
MQPVIFDIHQHVRGPDGGAPAMDTFDIDEDATTRLRLMDRFGVARAALLPTATFERPNGIQDIRAFNNLMARYRDRYRARFPIAAGVVDPMVGSKPGVEEIERIACELHLDGVVWHHHAQGAFINDRHMGPFLTEMARYGLKAFIHVIIASQMEDPWALEELAEQHPEVTIIALDAFAARARVFDMFGVLKRRPNVLMDTACFYTNSRLIEEFVHRFGPDRLLYGTDLHLHSPYTSAAVAAQSEGPPTSYHTPHVLAEIRDAPTLSQAEKEQILWKNACRVFNVSEQLTPA